MASLLHELENNEAMLMMFVANELPAEDRVEVEQMLASDLGLRAELVRIQSAYDSAIGALVKLDQDHSALPAENHAIRQAMRAMKQWQVDSFARQPMIHHPGAVKLPIWIYPFAGVAALLIGTIAWWGFGGQFNFGKGSGEVVPQVGRGPVTETAQVTASPEEVLTARRLDSSMQNDVPAPEQSNGIADAEIQANSLADRSDASWVGSPLFLTEANP